MREIAQTLGHNGKIDIDAFAARAWQAEADELRAEAAALSFDEKEHAAVCMLSAKKAEANAARPVQIDIYLENVQKGPVTCLFIKHRAPSTLSNP